MTTVSLEHVAQHFAEVSGRRITVAPEVAGLKLSGSLSIDNLDAFLRLLSKSPTLQVEYLSDGSVHIAPKDFSKQ